MHVLKAAAPRLGFLVVAASLLGIGADPLRAAEAQVQATPRYLIKNQGRLPRNATVMATDPAPSSRSCAGPWPT